MVASCRPKSPTSPSNWIDTASGSSKTPVQECVQCGKTLIDDSVMAEIEPLFDKEAHPSELELMRYAA